MTPSKKQAALIVSTSILAIALVVLAAIPLTSLAITKLGQADHTRQSGEIDATSGILTDGTMTFFDPECVPLPWVKRLDEQKKYAEKIISCMDAMWRPAIDQQSHKGMSIPTVILDSPNRPGEYICGKTEADEETSFYCNSNHKIRIWKYRGMTEHEMAQTVAHEYGHHIQNQIGVEESFRRMLATVQSEHRADRILHKRYEAQAECLGGFTFKYLLPEMADQFLADHDNGPEGEDINDTHPSYANNRMWFQRGMNSITSCDSWSAPESEVL